MITLEISKYAEIKKNVKKYEFASAGKWHVGRHKKYVLQGGKEGEVGKETPQKEMDNPSFLDVF